MCKYFKFGKYNKLYKYIFFCLICVFIYSYLFTTRFPEKIKIIKKNTLPEDILVQRTFDYFGIFIISLILYKYQMNTNKKSKLKKDNPPNSLNSTYSENNSPTISSWRLSSNELELIYNDNSQYYDVNFISFISPIIILILSLLLLDIFNNIGFSDFEYYMLEILFISVLNSIIFKQKLYSNQKVSIIFILIFFNFIINYIKYIIIK